MTKVTINIMGRKVDEYETEKEVTLESILKGIQEFKKDMDKLGIPCKISSANPER